MPEWLRGISFLALKQWYPQASSVRTQLIKEIKQIYHIMKALEKNSKKTY